MTEAFRCSHCSAPVTDDRWMNCPHCGTVLNKPTINPLKAVTAPERFAQARQNPAFADWMVHQPSTSAHQGGSAAKILFLFVWIVIAFAMAAAFPSGMKLFPIGMGLVGAFMVVKEIGFSAKVATGEWERILAVIRDERVAVSGGGKNTSATTTYHLLLENEQGERAEYPCHKRIAATHAPGDIGIAFLKGGVLFDFQRLDA
jgi:DNA-directed RNA polymerase subunit RPC12/RpoP